MKHSTLLESVLQHPNTVLSAFVIALVVFLSTVTSLLGLAQFFSLVYTGLASWQIGGFALAVSMLILYSAYAGHVYNLYWLKVSGHTLSVLTASIAILSGALVSDMQALDHVKVSQSIEAQITEVTTELSSREKLEAFALTQPTVVDAASAFNALSAKSLGPKGAVLWESTSNCTRPGKYTTSCSKLVTARDLYTAAVRAEVSKHEQNLKAQLKGLRVPTTQATPLNAEKANPLAVSVQRFVSTGALGIVYVIGGIVMAVMFELLFYITLFVVTLKAKSFNFDSYVAPKYDDVDDVDDVEPYSDLDEPAFVKREQVQLDQAWLMSKGLTGEQSILTLKLFGMYKPGCAIAIRSTHETLGIGRPKFQEMLEKLVGLDFIYASGVDGRTVYTWTTNTLNEVVTNDAN